MGDQEDGGPTPRNATHAAALASQDTATAAELDEAAAAGRAAGRRAYLLSERQPCPYRMGTLAAHVWLRWYVRARQTAAGVEPPS
jgi:hypothetical protein